MDILNVGRMDVNGQQQTIGIDDDVPLTAVDALTGIVAARTTSLCRRCALAVDHSGRRLRLPSKPPTPAAPEP